MDPVRPAPPSSRLELTREAGVLRIGYRTPRQPFVALFLAAWLTGWTWGGVATARLVLGDEQPLGAKLFLLLWLAGWAAGGAFALMAFLASVAGREELALDARTLRICNSGLGLGRTRTYDLAGIEALEPLAVRARPFQLVLTGGSTLSGGSIELRHRGKRVRFGRGLSEPDVERVVGELRSRLPARAKSW